MPPVYHRTFPPLEPAFDLPVFKELLRAKRASEARAAAIADGTFAGDSPERQDEDAGAAASAPSGSGRHRTGAEASEPAAGSREGGSDEAAAAAAGKRQAAAKRAARRAALQDSLNAKKATADALRQRLEALQAQRRDVAEQLKQAV